MAASEEQTRGGRTVGRNYPLQGGRLQMELDTGTRKVHKMWYILILKIHPSEISGFIFQSLQKITST